MPSALCQCPGDRSRGDRPPRIFFSMKIAVIIPAAGSSSRFNTGEDSILDPRSKLDEDLGGRPVLQRTVELFTNRPEVGAIIVAGPFDESAFARFELRHGDKLALARRDALPGRQNAPV